MASFLSILAATPLYFLHYLFNIVCCFHPQGRPDKGWTLNQALRVRTIRLLLLFWSRVRAGDRLILKPGREGNRFEVIKPKLRKFYKGPLEDAAIQPDTIGATWTPARPPRTAEMSKKHTTVLHIHGGAFVIGDGRDHDTGYLARAFIRHMGCTYVCTPQYRLASNKGGRFPAALQDTLTSYLHLVNDLGIPAAQIIVSGDSAGGNLALGLLRYINEYGQELGIPAPAAIMLWSPWTDPGLTLDPKFDITTLPNYAVDYMNADFPDWGARALTGNGLIDGEGPYLSPLRHPFTMSSSKIPIFVNGGGNELLCNEIKAFAKTFEKQGWNLHLVISKGCPHDALLLGPRLGFQREAVAAVRDARAPENMASTQDFDVIIIGAGISGINAAYRIQTQGPPGLKYAILEGRDSLGGTWDLFRYPGIRSDSDIFTFCYPWSQWKHIDTMATGEQMREYLARSASSNGIDQHIRYHHKVEAADWRSAEQSWVLQVNVADQEKPAIFKSRFVLLGTGYYDYETPLQTIIAGLENFKGKVIHPQFWPEDYDYTGKDIVIIGSGATAVTILPAVIDKAKCATMLQRSPGYIFSLPSRTFFTRLLFAILPISIAYSLNRTLWLWRNYLSNLFCKKYPEVAKKFIRKATEKQLPPNIKWDPHFKPYYNPWEQRFCACMNGDFFAALRSGKADVVTDTIKSVTAHSIELVSGASLHPDVIVTATGLKLKFGGGIDFTLDGTPFKVSDKFAWRAAMLEDVPNLLFMTGYENASWTLGADVSAHLFLRLLRLMEQKNARVIVPRTAGPMDEKPMMNLSSTYIRTAGRVFPKGGAECWSPKTSYFKDMAGATWGNLTKDLHFI
ncbi:FAD/NAD(P)-binding domain-containing protein [Nemania sp. FL0916]|nr:FAD/NAD(P)-binding domain-containing protein [Nemania sp. FL0916]